MTTFTEENWREWVDNAPLSDDLCRSRSTDLATPTNQHIEACRRIFERKILELVDPEGECSKRDLFRLRKTDRFKLSSYRCHV